MSNMAQAGSLMLGGFFIILALFLGLYNSSLQSDYDKYCTGLVGIFVEVGSEGKCSELKNMITMTSLGMGVSGIIGIILTILGLTKSNQTQQMVMVVPHPNQIYSNQPIVQQQSVVRTYQLPIQSMQPQKWENNFKFCQYCGRQNNTRNKKCSSCKFKF